MRTASGIFWESSTDWTISAVLEKSLEGLPNGDKTTVWASFATVLQEWRELVRKQNPLARKQGYILALETPQGTVRVSAYPLRMYWWSSLPLAGILSARTRTVQKVGAHARLRAPGRLLLVFDLED